MAGANTFDEAFIDLSYRGWESIKSGAGYLKSMGKDIGDSFDKLAGKATTTFASISAAVLGSTRAASPQVFDVFTGSLKALAMVIGASLAPLVVELTTYVAKAIQWWSNLDQGTKDLIVSGVKWTAMITGAIVALSTLNSVFGGFAKACFTFAASNPLLAAFTAVVGILTLAIAKTEELNKATMQNVKEVDRMKSGNVNEDDIKKSWVGKDLQAIADPQERAKKAQELIDKEKARMNDATGKITNQGSFSLGMSRIGQSMGFNTDTAELDKVQQDAGRNIAIATAIMNKAKEGKDLEVKPGGAKQADLFQNVMGLGMQQKAVQVGDLSSVWKNIQQSQQEDPSLAILKKLGVYQEANNELLKGVKDAIEKQNAALPVGG